MGMTIDKAMLNLHAIQDYYNDDMQDSYVGFDKEDNESVDIAISTMKKYQNIEDIYYHQSGEALENSLRAVIEDGKID